RRKPPAEASAGAVAAVSVERRAGAKGNTHQQSTYWTQSQGRVSKALERIRRLVPLPTRGRSRMRESRTYGSGRGAGHETHVPTATAPRVHHAARRRGGVAARCRGAGSDETGPNRFGPNRLAVQPERQRLSSRSDRAGANSVSIKTSFNFFAPRTPKQ